MGDKADLNKPVHSPGVRKGEEIREQDGKEPGRFDTETSETGRPSGKSTARDATAINDEAGNPIDEKSPTLLPS